MVFSIRSPATMIVDMSCNSSRIILFLIVILMTVLDMNALRYNRTTEPGTPLTHVAIYKGNNITELLDEVCVRIDENLTCFRDEITNSTIKQFHEDKFNEAKDKLRWLMTEYENPTKMGVLFIIFLVCLIGGIYLMLLGHMDCRQCGHEIVYDGTFGFDLTIIRSMKHRLVSIGHRQYIRVVETKIIEAMDIEQAAKEELERRRSKVKAKTKKKGPKELTHEELVALGSERRKHRTEERKRARFEESLNEAKAAKATEQGENEKRDKYQAQLMKKAPIDGTIKVPQTDMPPLPDASNPNVASKP